MSTSPPAPHFTEAYAQEDNSRALRAVSVTFIILELAFVGLRYYGRAQSNEKIGVDDVLIIPSLLVVVAAPALALALIEYGSAGRHTSVILATDPAIYEEFNKIQLALEIVYIFGVALPKLAVLSLLSRIFIQRWFRYACFAIGAILTASAIVNTVIACLMCRPLAALWDLSIKAAQCLDLAKFYRWVSLPNILTDLTMLVLPIPAVAKLHLSLAMKIKLVATFAAGGLGISVSIVRFVTFWRLNEDADIMYLAGTIGIYTIVETGGYLISACVLNFRKFLSGRPIGLLSRSYLLSPFRGIFSKRTTEDSASSQMKAGKMSNLMRPHAGNNSWYGDTVPLKDYNGQAGQSHLAYTETGRDESDKPLSTKDKDTIKMHREVYVTAE